MRRNYLRQARLFSGRSQEEVAEILGCSNEWVSRFERGSYCKYGITISTAEKISKAYKIPFKKVCAEELDFLKKAAEA